MTQKLLFLATLGCAAGLGSAVVGAPWLDDPGPVGELFAADRAVRHTALASAAGLVVTAFVFFRPAPPPPRKRAARAAPNNIAGA